MGLIFLQAQIKGLDSFYQPHVLFCFSLEISLSLVFPPKPVRYF